MNFTHSKNYILSALTFIGLIQFSYAENRMDELERRWTQLIQQQKTPEQQLSFAQEIEKFQNEIRYHALKRASSQDEIDKYQQGIDKLVEQYKGDHQIHLYCRKSMEYQFDGVKTDNNPIRQTLLEMMLMSGEEACINASIRILLSKTVVFINEKNELNLTKKPIELVLPTTKDFSFLYSVVQNGDEIEWTFNDVIPELAGQKIYAVFKIEDNSIHFENSVKHKTTVDKKWLFYPLNE